MAIDLNTLKEKFELKGYNLYNFFIPTPRIFDPSHFMLLNHTREEAYKKFKEDYKHEFAWQEKVLDELNTWIDYQRHKF